MIKSGLLQSEGFHGMGHILKLADFGLATFHSKGQGLRKTKCGTPRYMAPELSRLPRKSRGYGLPIDVWAAGVLMSVVMCGDEHPDDGHFDLRPLVPCRVPL